jgi:hypothetical protein
VSVTDQCAYCGGDCPMGDCPTCHGCESESTCPQPCPDCQPPYSAEDVCPDCGRPDCTGEDCYWPEEAWPEDYADDRA